MFIDNKDLPFPRRIDGTDGFKELYKRSQAEINWTPFEFKSCALLRTMVMRDAIVEEDGERDRWTTAGATGKRQEDDGVSTRAVRPSERVRNTAS